MQYKLRGTKMTTEMLSLSLVNKTGANDFQRASRCLLVLAESLFHLSYFCTTLRC